MSNTLKKGEFAKYAAIVNSSVTKLIKRAPKGVLLGDRINMDHPFIHEYLKKRGIEPPQVTPSYVENAGKSEKSRLPEEVTEILDYSLREILRRFGTDSDFNSLLKAATSIEVIEEKRIKNAISKGELVSRELVYEQFIAPVERMIIRLLTDGKKTISLKAVTIVKSGGDTAEVGKMIEDQVESIVGPFKKKIGKSLSHV